MQIKPVTYLNQTDHKSHAYNHYYGLERSVDVYRLTGCTFYFNRTHLTALFNNRSSFTLVKFECVSPVINNFVKFVITDFQKIYLMEKKPLTGLSYICKKYRLLAGCREGSDLLW